MPLYDSLADFESDDKMRGVEGFKSSDGKFVDQDGNVVTKSDQNDVNKVK